MRTELALVIEGTYIYEFALQTTNRHVVWGDNQLPTTSYGRNFDFDLHHVYFPHALNQTKKIFKPPKCRFLYAQLQLEFEKDRLIPNEEKEITKRLNLLQDTFFIYDHSALVQQSFITELNKFLPICCSASNFSEKKIKK